MMVWEALLWFDKCPLVFMPLDRQTSIDFLNAAYEGCFSEFKFIYNVPSML